MNTRTGERVGEYTEELLTSLIKQIPNRIYFSPINRTVCCVLIHGKPSTPYNAKIETLQFQPGQPNLQVVSSEGFVAISPAALESEISWWRRQNQLYGDLLLEPTYVMEDPTIPEDFIHFASVRRQMDKIRSSDFIQLRYHLTSLNGLRVTELNIVPLSIEKFKRLPHPPLEIVRHSNPFEVPFESLFPFNHPTTPIPLWLTNLVKA